MPPRPSALRSKKVIRMVAAGLSFGQVAARLGCTRNTIAGTMYRHNTAPSKRSYWRKKQEKTNGLVQIHPGRVVAGKTPS